MTMMTSWYYGGEKVEEKRTTVRCSVQNKWHVHVEVSTVSYMIDEIGVHTTVVIIR